MKQIKFVILGAGLLGLIAFFFLPYVSAGGLRITLWEGRKGPESGQVYLVMLCFLVPFILGVMAAVKGGPARWQSIVATLCFLLGVIKTRDAFGDFMGAGAKILFFSGLIGLIAAIASIVKPAEE